MEIEERTKAWRVKTNRKILSYDYEVASIDSRSRAYEKSILYPLIIRAREHKFYMLIHKDNILKIAKRAAPIEKYCRCGNKLIKKGKILKCKKCGFLNKSKLICRYCFNSRVVRINKTKNKCMCCGLTWSYKKILHSSFVNKQVLKIRHKLKQIYLNKIISLENELDSTTNKYLKLKDKLGEHFTFENRNGKN